MVSIDRYALLLIFAVNLVVFLLWATRKYTLSWMTLRRRRTLCLLRGERCLRTPANELYTAHPGAVELAR